MAYQVHWVEVAAATYRGMSKAGQDAVNAVLSDLLADPSIGDRGSDGSWTYATPDVVVMYSIAERWLRLHMLRIVSTK